MSQFYRNSAAGRTRRPKNILGPDGTTINAGTAGAGLASDVPLTNDVTMAITAVTISNQFLTFTVATGTAILEGQTIFISGCPEPRLNTGLRVYSKPSANEIRIFLDGDLRNITSVATGGQLRRRTVDGYSTENARFLHIHHAGGN